MRNLKVLLAAYMSLLLFVLGGCSNEEIKGGEAQGDGVSVSFVAELNGKTDVSTRSAANLGEANKLTVLAYKKVGENYQFVKKTSTDIAAEDDNTLSWKDPQFKLEIGVYRFVAFYNVGGDLELEYPGDDVAAAWNDILSQILIKRTGTGSLDVNEVFASKESDMEDVDLVAAQENSEVVVPITLDRVNSRIDFRFRKLNATDDNEQGYEGDKTILGDKDAFTGITTEAKSVPQWTWGSTAVALAGDVLTFATQGTDNITFGNGDVTDFPEKEGDRLLMDNVPAERIMNGAAYYRGAYILPFANGDEANKLDLNVTLSAGNQTRKLVVEKVPAQKNVVTVVSFNYRASMTVDPDDPDSPDPDDDENVFTPSIKYNITIETQWNGVDLSTNVDI